MDQESGNHAGETLAMRVTTPVCFLRCGFRGVLPPICCHRFAT
jgi:hypothetical protein